MNIKENQVALFVQNGKYTGLGRNKFSVPFFSDVEIYDQELEFIPESEKIRYIKDRPFLAREMDFYIIKENEIGLYFINSKPTALFRSGEYAFLKGPTIHTVLIYDVEYELIPKDFKMEFIKDLEFIKDEISIIEIKDHELGFHYLNGRFNKILSPGTHAFWKSRLEHEIKIVDLNELEIDQNLYEPAVFQQLVKKDLVKAYTVESWGVGLLFIDGQLKTLLEPGVYYYWKFFKTISVTLADLRQQAIDIQGQEILTKDRVPLRINFFAQYRIVDVMKSLVNIADFKAQLYTVLQLSLREYIGSMNFDDILAKKEEIGAFVNDKMKSHADDLGIEMIFSGIKDIILPGEIREIMNQVLIAEKRAQANVIMRREETASTRSLLNTAKLLEENKILYHLKELEYIEKISERLTQVSINGGSAHILEELRRLFIPPKP